MRLKGTLTEKHAEEELAVLQRGFVCHPQFKHMMEIIREHIPDAVSARAYGWIPDNQDDVLTILVDDSHLIQIEVPGEREAEPKIESIVATAVGSKRQDQIKLAVALKLIPGAKF